MEDTSGHDSYEFVAEFYDHIGPYRDRTDVAFFVDMAREVGGPVLEVGCGTGRVLLPTARAGIEITGLDLSRRMLAVAEREIAAEAEDVRARIDLVRADMRAFDLGRLYNLVTMPFRPFQHLAAVDDQLACLRSINRHLAIGGTFVLDVFDPWLNALVEERFTEEFNHEPPFTMPDGRVVERKHRSAYRDRVRQVIGVELIYDVRNPDGSQERLIHAFPMRYFFRYEVEHLLARCGFSIETVYSDYDRKPFGEKYPGELLVVARKTSEA